VSAGIMDSPTSNQWIWGNLVPVKPTPTIATAKKRKQDHQMDRAGCTSTSGGPRTAQQTLDLITTLITMNAAA
jgi:hypothetical protein